MQPNDDYYNYQQSLSPELEYDRLHFFDYLLLGISVVAILFGVVSGITEQNQRNEITKKDNDITQIMSALSMYYADSSKIPSEQRYPLAVCNGRPNEVDFEYTLKNSLAGENKSKSNFEYIAKSDYPMDTSGDNHTQVRDKKTKLRDCPKVFGTSKKTEFVYPDQSNSCDFDKDSVLTKFKNCYLYATDTQGFEYKIG